MAGAAFYEEQPGRFMLSGWPTRYMEAIHLRPLIREWRLLVRLGVIQECRALIVDGVEKHEAFAKAFGFRLDAGPMTGFSPTGEDMNLWLWRVSDGQ